MSLDNWNGKKTERKNTIKYSARAHSPSSFAEVRHFALCHEDLSVALAGRIVRVLDARFFHELFVPLPFRFAVVVLELIRVSVFENQAVQALLRELLELLEGGVELLLEFF